MYINVYISHASDVSSMHINQFVNIMSECVETKYQSLIFQEFMIQLTLDILIVMDGL